LKIFLRIPTAHGVDREMTRWLVWFAREMPDADIDIHYSCWGVVENRNEICRQFLKSDCTHLWMLDSDTIPPRNLSLLEDVEAHHCLNGIYQHLTPHGLIWDVWHKTPEGKFVPRPQRKWPKEKVFEVDAVGTGCMMLDREIVDGMMPFGGHLFEKTDQGEDFNFCNEARDQGFEVMVNSHYRCDHQKDVSLKLLSRITKGI
jgi:hypothetical protein